ncbi:MAG: methyltransferase [Acidobacteria bacterium]|nr:methyltransferase [Acidobacteriota bacterium]
MTPVPFRFGSDEQFTQVRELFVRSQFTGQQLRKLRITDSDSAAAWDAPSDIPPPFSLLFHLFLQAGYAEAEDLRTVLGQTGLTVLLDLGLVRQDGTTCHPTVRIRPYMEIYVLSDIWKEVAGFQSDFMDDIVLMPDSSDTRRYVGFLPTDPCERFLEACGGSGVAALLAAKYCARHAWSTDIAERSAEFARFGARLNALTNFTSLAGDIYSSVEGMQFDRIAAHPPFVPTLKHTWLFHDGGEDGESIMRRHVEGLPRVLAPGGRFYCRAMCAERVDSAIEQRLRAWLGSEQDQFDIAVFELPPADPVHSAVRSAIRWNMTGLQIEELIKRYREMKIKNFQFAYTVIQRHREPRPPFTIRRRRTAHNGPAHMEWLMRWEELRVNGGSDLILNKRVRAGSPRMHQSLTLAEGGWDMHAQRMEVSHPFPLTWDVDGLANYLLPQLDGTRTGRQIFETLVKDGALAPDADPGPFAAALGQLVSGGIILLEGHEPPPPIESKDSDE